MKVFGSCISVCSVDALCQFLYEMDDSSCNSSWHPALMPNSHDTPVATAVEDSAQQTLLSSIHAPLRSKDDSFDPVNTENEALSSRGDPAVAVAVQDAEDRDDTWPTSDDHAAHAPNAEENLRNAEEASRTVATNVSNSNAQHSSSMSFARTVSHEVNFNDEEDAEWNLPRADADHFKSMPSPEWKNSVPSATPGNQERDKTLLPSTRALDKLRETETYIKGGDGPSKADASNNMCLEKVSTVSSPPSRADVHTAVVRLMGSDMPSTESQESSERFEEGVPLVSSKEEYSAATVQSHSSALEDSFANDGDNDDFFAQVEATGGEQGLEPTFLERKAPLQSIGDTTDDPNSQKRTSEDHAVGIDGNATSETNASKLVLHDKGEVNLAPNDPEKEDLSAVWEEAFGGPDEDDFLLEDAAGVKEEVDAAAFLGDDDEGLLDDEDGSGGLRTTKPATTQPTRYQPWNTSTQQPSSPYAPMSATQAEPFYGSAYAATGPPASTPPASMTPYGETFQPRPTAIKAQSFADKAKGGYSSPYDLPTDLVSSVVKPRKRPSMQQLSSTQPQPPPPPRSVSSSGINLRTAAHPNSIRDGEITPEKPLTSSPHHSNSFFEELPAGTKPRPGSRHSNRAPSPAMHPPPPPAAIRATPPPAAMASDTQRPRNIPGVSNLVSPERMSPYVALQSSPPSSVPSTTATRYSPAPSQTPGFPAAIPSRYSPAPPTPRPSRAYSPTSGTGHGATLPHQPRTSSPLAHFESIGDRPMPDRRASSSHDSKHNRGPYLPATTEVDEEDEQQPMERAVSAGHVSSAQGTKSRYSPVPAAVPGRISSPASHDSQPTMSPPRRAISNYAPKAPVTVPTSTMPARSESASPVTARGKQSTIAPETPRAASARPSSSAGLARSSQPVHASASRVRGRSLTMNMTAPTDGREHDPLQRWKGIPIVTWGVGGILVTTFPTVIPRYGMNQTQPSAMLTAGEVKIRAIKDIEPLQDLFSKFPGPLKGKSKKKEVLAWLTSRIEALERDLPEISFHSELSLELKRVIERLLLWKILKIFVEFDGDLEGSPAVVKAVRDVLSPGTVTPTSDTDGMFPSGSALGARPTPATPMNSDGADAATMEQIRSDLLRGNQEAAVWAAVDKRLWGHAMLISHTVSVDLYKTVAQEFVRKEVNYAGHKNESIAALYKIMSGSQDDCVDELVPSHARAGLQLMSTDAVQPSPNDTIDGLDKWRETLTLVLSNRSADDTRGLNALGTLLAGYGRTEAAHICFMFSRNVSIFGGMDDPSANFVLIGSDQQQNHSVSELEAIQLSEVYEYGLSLAGIPGYSAGVPHLAAYKLQHAVTLAEYGYRDKALQYCEAIAGAMASQTRRSPYHHAVLEAAVDDFMIRLKQAPKGEATSWISKPSMGKVSDSMWSRFNKFVAGDDNENASSNGPDGQNGPFARVGENPNMSPPASISNFETFGMASSALTANVSGTTPASEAPGNSRYVPLSRKPSGQLSHYEPTPHYAPAIASTEQAPIEPTPNIPASFESSYPGYEENGQIISQVAPAQGSLYQPANLDQRPPGLQESPDIYPGYGKAQLSSDPSYFAYQPAHDYEELQHEGYQPLGGSNPPQEIEYSSHDTHMENYAPNSFQPYGFEPPSYESGPDTTNDDDVDAQKRKKKGIMYDDDDDIPALRVQGFQEKSKAEKDRENEEMFRKAAEEDGECLKPVMQPNVERVLTEIFSQTCGGAASGQERLGFIQLVRRWQESRGQRTRRISQQTYQGQVGRSQQLCLRS